jgi:hypothetical protein
LSPVVAALEGRTLLAANPFAGVYQGSFQGSGPVAGVGFVPVSGQVTFTVDANGNITVTVPGPGSGTVSPTGVASAGVALGGGAVHGGADYTFTGNFMATGTGLDTASGGWTANSPVGSSQGQWSATAVAPLPGGGNGSTGQEAPPSHTTAPSPGSAIVPKQRTWRAIAGHSFPMTFSVVTHGSYLATATNDAATLSIAGGPSGGGFGDPTTSLSGNVVNGVATFNVDLNKAGTYKLLFSVGSLHTQVSATVAAGPATQLVSQSGPTSALAGRRVPALKLRVLDEDGNPVNGQSVALQIISGPAGFARGSRTTIRSVNGTAAFNQLIFDVAGTYTLAATAGDLTTNLSVTVQPATASKLIFVTVPTSATADQSVTPPITVQVEDRFGNLVTAGTPAVTLAVGTSPRRGFEKGGLATVFAVDGIATFDDVVFDTSGSEILTATSRRLLSALSGFIAVNSG